MVESADAEDAIPVQPGPRLYELVVNRVLGIVRDRHLRPGDALPTERELAEELTVSRNVLRQAFGVLEDRGLIVTRRGSGRFLRSIETSDRPAEPAMLEVASIADILEARILLEEQVAALACQRRTVHEARNLFRLATRLTTWRDNLAFHVGVAATTHNFMLERLVREQAELLGELNQREHYQDPDALTKSRSDHHAIATAIAERNEAAAHTLVRRHLQSTRHMLTDTPRQASNDGISYA